MIIDNRGKSRFLLYGSYTEFRPNGTSFMNGEARVRTSKLWQYITNKNMADQDLIISSNISYPSINNKYRHNKDDNIYICIQVSTNIDTSCGLWIDIKGYGTENGVENDILDIKYIVSIVSSSGTYDGLNEEQNDARKIWIIGPEPKGTNILVDMTKAVQYMNEVKPSFIAGFMSATNNGVLCKENVRGIRFNIVDCILHADTIHRGQGQMIPPVMRSIHASMLCAKPVIYEPIYLIEIQTPNDMIGIIYSCLSQKRGHVVSEEPKLGTPLTILKGFLPVIESFGFTGYLRSKTSGMAFPQMIFSHYDVVSGDVFEKGSRPNTYVMDSRKRKDMKMELPTVTEYIDRL